MRGATQSPVRPLIIAHRGASGRLPEHTLEAYNLAIDQGADYIEPDVVASKDGVLIARHENEIGGTTDVEEKYPERRATRVIDGRTVSGWFTEDFTAQELSTLRARERLLHRSHAFDGLFKVPTLRDVLKLVRERERQTGRTIGVYPETKHPSYFNALGVPLEERLLADLAEFGYRAREDEVFIQSFETGNLRALSSATTIRLVQLIEAEGAPYDLAAGGPLRRYSDLITPAGLAEISAYAGAIGPAKSLVLSSPTASPSSLVRDAHGVGLAVHVWTLRSDAPFLDEGWKGDPLAEWRRYRDCGVDGMFGDFPEDGVRALRL